MPQLRRVIRLSGDETFDRRCASRGAVGVLMFTRYRDDGDASALLTVRVDGRRLPTSRPATSAPRGRRSGVAPDGKLILRAAFEDDD